MTTPPDKRNAKGGKKVRVPFRRNRSKRARVSDWTQKARDAEDNEVDADTEESVSGKGDLSRGRTVIVPDGETTSASDLKAGVVVAVRGLYADVDDGTHLYSCTIRRVLRTRLIDERHPVTVGDHIRFQAETPRLATGDDPSTSSPLTEGVIEEVRPRRGQLRRKVGKRIHTIAANIDQAIIVGSAGEPAPKPHLIDRYIVAAHAGEITPIVCMNKIDLDTDSSAQAILDRYDRLGYATLCTSAVRGDGLDTLRSLLADKSSVIAGQSGVGKSSLLNSIQPGLQLRTGDIVEHTSKGRHTTVTARLLRLDVGGYVVDTPGVKSFDLSAVGRHELEMHFIEFVEHVTHCRFADCTHIHEDSCAVQQAVEDGAIHVDRYESYVRLFEEPTDGVRRR